MSTHPDISVIVPTLNEAVNLPRLVEQIDAALAGRLYEIVVVDDDSADDTVAVCDELSRRYPVRLIVRRPPADGLGGAVLHGMREARGRLLAVMDADLQHPPSALPALLAGLEHGADFVIGSRHVSGARIGEAWGLWRRCNSRLAAALARPLAGPVRDPMSGFFALRRDTFAGARRLTPLGYKIGLELLCKCRVTRVREVPIHFATRTHGASKLTVRERFRYLEHLSRLYDFAYPRASPILKFLIVTISSWAAGFGAYVALGRGGMAPPWATAVAYLPAIGITAIFHARYVRTQRAFLVRDRPWTDFLLSSAGEWIACLLTAAYLTARLRGASDLDLFALPFAAALCARYVLRKELLLDVRGLRRLPQDEDRR